VKLVQQWILQALVGHRDMELAGVANPDQNLRNILWDEKNQQIKFVEMGCAREKFFWDNNTFNFIDCVNLTRPYFVPQNWAYLGLFFPQENERIEYWEFLKQIKTMPTAQKALDFAVQENGYLHEILKATKLYITAPKFENFDSRLPNNSNPTHLNNPPNPNLTHSHDSTDSTDSTKKYNYVPYLCIGGVLVPLIIGVTIGSIIYYKKNKNQQASHVI